MIHHQVVQGGSEWARLRLGIPCASEMERVVTAKTWKPVSGEARRKYLVRLLTERILDCPLDDAVTPAMIHGTDYEKKTRAAYELLTGWDVVDAGFCTNDAGTVGASPDGFVEDADISVEFKSPFRPDIHMGYVLEPDLLRQEYFLQVQTQLWVCQKKAVDLVSGFAGLPMVRITVTPHPEFQEKLAAALSTFVSDLALLVELAKDRGWLSSAPREQPVGSAKDDGLSAFGISEADINSYVESLRADGKLPPTLEDQRAMTAAEALKTLW